MIHDGCEGCEHEEKTEKSKQCAGCRNILRDKYSPRNLIHDGCAGCDYELQDRNNKNCKACRHNAPDKYKPKRVATLTERDNLGNWGAKGIPWETLRPGKKITEKMNEILYGCLFKLMQYESTGLTPEQVEQLMEDK